jgi:hypothetical protein
LAGLQAAIKPPAGLPADFLDSTRRRRGRTSFAADTRRPGARVRDTAGQPRPGSTSNLAASPRPSRSPVCRARSPFPYRRVGDDEDVQERRALDSRAAIEIAS